ncbi:hypothetical protein L798_15171 [Zootermopsis nevadensis]|uniref:Uncharacterized protein n=1 Tax=Zootermopsis nevadensis TaxID=136037 RepID=A0A067QW12_ZOONE|nr:hypothetical protein L798_15171 [Zootermopsis nevadensis]
MKEATPISSLNSVDPRGYRPVSACNVLDIYISVLRIQDNYFVNTAPNRTNLSALRSQVEFMYQLNISLCKTYLMNFVQVKLLPSFAVRTKIFYPPISHVKT